jgi:hypothetical protein
VLQREVLVGKRRAVNGLAARAVEGLKVTSLAHDVGTDAVEDAALVMQQPPALAAALQRSGGALGLVPWPQRHWRARLYSRGGFGPRPLGRA